MGRRPPPPGVAQIADRRNAVVVQGIYRAWVTAKTASDLYPLDTTADIVAASKRPGGCEAALEAARVMAEAEVEARIAAGHPILHTLLRGGDSIGPWWSFDELRVPRTPFFKADVLYRIEANDVVEVNISATRDIGSAAPSRRSGGWRRLRQAEEKKRKERERQQAEARQAGAIDAGVAQIGRCGPRQAGRVLNEITML